MLKIKVARSLVAIVFILLMNNFNNPIKATETDKEFETTIRQRFEESEIEYTLDQRFEELQLKGHFIKLRLHTLIA